MIRAPLAESRARRAPWFNRHHRLAQEPRAADLVRGRGRGTAIMLEITAAFAVTPIITANIGAVSPGS
jgi:hypothetical protein